MDISQMGNTSEDSPASADSWPRARVQTEDPVVNAALAALETIPETPTAEHHAVYTALHDRLMAELNAEPPEER
ncbi:hypothetical protein ABIB35_002851 [Arthrobacter sp. UYP6]|uniref:hypothetical protein n=1 Tax=Arthrobacter sp. UYP6 TaxID=1756378 RepID=UPI00339238A7